ncbi:MAG: carboxylate--amine ligase, partial [Bryobacteraceae bacterium]
DAASGVMMIPIPRAGVYEGVAGVDDADDVIITAKVGQMLVPLPEGASYLGFIFARGGDPAEVEQALRRAHAKLSFRIATALPTMRAG